MVLEIQASRTQKIVSRVIIAVLILSLAVMPLLNLGRVKAVKDGNITTYTSPASLYFLIQSVVLGLAVCIVGVFYTKQRHGFFRLAGVAIFIVGSFILFDSPTGLNHQLVVTPDYFYQRIGSWYSPQETKVEFKDVKYMQIDENAKWGGRRRSYDLAYFTDANTNEVRIEINDLMKAALPEIYDRAAAKNVFIGDGPDGGQIPSDL